jgi:hypothetical protein
MSDERNVGGLEKLVGKVLGGIEKFCKPVTKHAPNVMKSLYNGTKDLFLQYACGSLDKVGGFVKEHPVLSLVGLASFTFAYPFAYAYSSYFVNAVLPNVVYPVMYPYMF